MYVYFKGSFKKCVCSKLPIRFPSCSTLFVLHVPLPQRTFTLVTNTPSFANTPPLRKYSATLMNIRMKNRGVNREKKVYLLCKWNIKDQFILNSYIYNDNKNIDMFIKKASNNKKKNVYLLLKNTFIYLSRLKTEKFSGTPNQLVRKNSICCLKNDRFFFHRANVQTGLTPSSLLAFVCSLRTPFPPSTTNILFE